MNRTPAAIVALVAIGISLSACDTKTTSVTDQSSKSQATAKTKAGTKAKPKTHYTVSQTQAIGAAKDYLSLTGFSRLGLIGQLSSKAGDGYSKADATFAVDHITVNWNEEAVKSAKEYLKISHFSRSGLIEQLSSAAGDQYTKAQATYAADHVGL